MLSCPTCSGRLCRSRTRDGKVYPCLSCGGRAVALGVLRTSAKPDFLRRLRHKAAHTPIEEAKSCPLCERAMAKVNFAAHDDGVVLDLCRPCQIIWFDPTEYEEVRQVAPPEAARAERAGPAGQPGPSDGEESSFGLTRPSHAWQILPAILGLPIELGPNRVQNKPIITWSLAAGVALVFLTLTACGGNALMEAIFRWGLIPARWTRGGGLTLLTSFFLHASWWHLLSNAYFLLIFGDNVEDHLGRVRFVLLVAASHLGGMLLHAVITGPGNVPCVGASAGIAGVIAYYAMVFPRAKIGIFGWFWTLLHILRMPAIAGLLIYVGIQIVGARLTYNRPTAHVAYLAHLGGLAVGAIAALFSLAMREDDA